MTVRNDQELRNTKVKLQQLEQLIEQAHSSSGPGRDTEIRSLTQLRDQLQEEIAHFETEAVSPRR
jgi:hypothetical protein